MLRHNLIGALWGLCEGILGRGRQLVAVSPGRVGDWRVAVSDSQPWEGRRLEARERVDEGGQGIGRG